MKRLYLRIYVALLASLVVLALAAGLAWHLFARDMVSGPTNVALSEAVAELLPAAAPPEQLAATLSRWGQRFDFDLSLYGRDGRLLASTANVLPPDAAGVPDSAEESAWWRHAPFAIHLPDQRRLLLERHRTVSPRWRSGLAAWPGVIVPLLLLALVVGVSAYPVVRWVTQRLEELARAVDALGAGDLSARVPVRGRDEVARLARKFNRSAERIEALVASNRSLLANASHELRSPLARIRMAIGLLDTDAQCAAGPAALELRAELDRNITELDGLIDEILLSSRLDAAPDLGGTPGVSLAEIDPTGLIAEECARAGAQFEPTAPAAQRLVLGDARLLRRLVRNLVENARRYGGAAPVEVDLAQRDVELVLSVCDRGPGVAESERERIFEPFYRARGASERDGGTGLGLALVRRIAQLHAGRVSCQPREGGGSCFVVELPLAKNFATV